MANNPTTYAQTGVDYSAMDPVKVLAQKAALSTAQNHARFGATEVGASRGESAYVWEEKDAYRALVIEGLGTKNLVADAMRKTTGKTYYDSLAQDTVAMIVNDLIVVGALPQVVNAYFALGDGAWMNDRKRATDLVTGWAGACNAIGAAWGGGETPALKGIINPDTIDLGGSAVGIINPKENLVLGDKLADGDEIILVESSGIHANGISFVRHLYEKTPQLYETTLSNGKLFGEAILTPTLLYVPLVRDVLEAGVVPHYMVNVTGHGWRKLMRANAAFTYEIETILEPQPEFLHMQAESRVDDSEMYGNFNMGVGFVLYVAPQDTDSVLAAAKRNGVKAIRGGKVKRGKKQVIIKPKNLTFSAETLEVR
ncbi:phosphoribosylformylglycinamidine cyclo-ligase [Candidatus Saccharibacteria bacterium]|nr:MAG: phosphoribosylformylglycinamidine cyclo-ligase [Candidatus Saccharibacteria bacterium]